MVHLFLFIHLYSYFCRLQFPVDTGYDLGHVDLPTAQDGVVGTDTSEGIALEDPIDSHGTHVSGTIGAVKNGIGVVGGKYRYRVQLQV